MEIDPQINVSDIEQVLVLKGSPQPTGIFIRENETNFSLVSRKAVKVALSVFTPDKKLLLETPLFRTGHVWHVKILNLPDVFHYGYRIYLTENPASLPPLILDPYAKEVDTPRKWAAKSDQDDAYRPLGTVVRSGVFDWKDVDLPNIPMKDLIIYEMHVRGFTQDPSSGVQHPGTFLGVIEKIPYLLELGINAVEFLPLNEFNELEYKKYNPLNYQRLCNYWGYSSVGFFALMNRYVSGEEAGAPIHEFKTMVRELHRNGIEVILDIVFNHTAEGNELGPTISFRAIDEELYYLLDSKKQHTNYTGCGNTLNCNHPTVIELILASLRYWVIDMHVDGFRFDLASILTRNSEGIPLHPSPLLEAISEDPILAHTKLIAEPWDAAGLYQVGGFYPKRARWSEWNGKYRDSLRRYMKGTPGSKGEFVTRLSGSQDLYWSMSPVASINFITAHDGFTMGDLVSYNTKHNMNNGEENQDGSNDNDSWNCGTEGKTQNKKIQSLRKRQIKNFFIALLLSQGVPMLLMGDEYAHTKEGNNNTWCQDNELNWFLWNEIQNNRGLFRFVKLMIAFRKKHSILHLGRFLTDSDVEWHGKQPLKPKWQEHDLFVAFTMKDPENGEDIYAAFNPQAEAVDIEFPLPPEHLAWHWIANTINPPPFDIIEESEAQRVTHQHYKLSAHSSIILKLIKV